MWNKLRKWLVNAYTGQVECEVASRGYIVAATLVCDDAVGNTVTVIADSGTTAFLGKGSEVVRSDRLCIC